MVVFASGRGAQRVEVSEEMVLGAIRAASVAHYGIGLGEKYGLPAVVWDKVRPKGMPPARSICLTYGLVTSLHSKMSAAWDEVLRKAGLVRMPMRKTIELAKGDRWREEESERWRPVERVETRWYREGLEVIPRKREVRAWDVRRHCYRVVGYRVMYEVR